MTQTGLLARLKLAAGVAGGAVIVVGLAAWSFGIRVNTSPSLPTGLYGPTTARQGAMAVFCPPEPYATLALQRGYRTAGSCPDGGTPLMKPIVAESGDVVVLGQDGVSVNGRLKTNSAPRAEDSNHRPLTHFPFGTYRLHAGEVWVISEYNPRSYDSRYFGPISMGLLQARVAPILTLD